MNEVVCPDCGRQARWCDNAEVYGRRYGKSYMCYWCEPCGTYVGCHNNTKRPLGTMANKALRQKRMETHAVIDPIWKSGRYSRSWVYRKLADHFGFEVHVGASDAAMCDRIQEAAKTLFTK